MVLVDAGPLIALIHADDQHHRRCVATFQQLTEPLGTVWPVLTEAMSRMRELMKKYRDLPMDLADAALVAVAEREKVRRIFTLDRRDFEVYRPAKLGRFILLPQ